MRASRRVATGPAHTTGMDKLADIADPCWCPRCQDKPAGRHISALCLLCELESVAQVAA